MTRDLLLAADRLADVIARENAVLAVFDIAGAGALLAEKNAAADAFAAAQAAGPPPAGPERRAVAARTAQLREAVAENKIRLELAMAVQGRIIGIVALAGRSVLARSAPRYGVRGQPAEAAVVAMALSARA